MLSRYFAGYWQKLPYRAALGIPLMVAEHYLITRPVNRRVKQGQMDPTRAFIGTLVIGQALGLFAWYMGAKLADRNK